MINTNDIIRYTTSIGGYTDYHILKVNGDITHIAWKNSNGDMDVAEIDNIEELIKSGHIKIVGTHNGKPSKYLRPHSFKVTSRNLPWHNYNEYNPYSNPKLYNW